MRKNFLVLLIICLIAILPSSVYAQEGTNEKTIKDVVKSMFANTVKITGYAQMGYIYQDDNAKDISTFKINHVRLFLNGTFGKIFEYRIQMEGFSNSKDQQNKSMISIHDMFVKAHICPALTLELGQFPNPLSMENFELSPATRETVDASTLVNRMVCYNPVSKINNSGRDCGIMAYGSFFPQEKFSIINYNIVLSNGSQLNGPDANKSKDFVGRLIIQPIKDLKISVSTMIGNSNIVGSDKSANLKRYVAGAYYNHHNGFRVRSEYGKVSCDDKGLDINQNMFYAIVAYNFQGKYMPIFRYDTYKDANVDNSRENNYLVGLLYTPISRLRVQADYTYSKYGDALNKNDGKLFQLMVTIFM